MEALKFIFLLILPTFVFSDEFHPRPNVYENPLVQKSSKVNDDWFAQGHDHVSRSVKRSLNTKTAKNVIFFLGDGMSIATVTATRVYLGGEEVQLSFEKFPHFGLAKTYCVDAQVSDSACTANAFLTGVKNNFGGIGVTANVLRDQCTFREEDKVSSILKWAQDAGKGTGVVTTTRITHATPSVAYAHIAFRDWEADTLLPTACRNTTVDIASQLIGNEEGKRLKVILGGGRRNFLPLTTVDDEGTKGLRSDGRNLIDEYLAEKSARGKAKYVWNKQQLDSLDIQNTDYLLGLFEADHLLYRLEAEARGLKASEPMLSDLTRTAIKMLQKERNGYFLFVEGGKIDHAHHSNLARKALDETAEFSKAIEVAKSMTSDEDTLIVVSSDHSHVFTIAGYAPRKNDILKIAGTGLDNLPYETLSYANGPGYARTYTASGRANMANDNFNDINRMHSATVPWAAETHAAEDVGVYATGPWSHLFHGSYEQNTIPVAMAYAAKIGPYQ